MKRLKYYGKRLKYYGLMLFCCFTNHNRDSITYFCMVYKNSLQQFLLLLQ